MAEQTDDPIEEIKKLEERKSHLERWMDGFRQTREAAPYIQQALDQVDWQLRVLKKRPLESSEIPLPKNTELLAQENEYLEKYLPPINPVDWSILKLASTITASGSSDYFEYVSRVGDIDTPDAKEYAGTYITEYQQMQEAHQRIEQVQLFIAKLCEPNTIERFERALNSYMAAKSRTGEQTAAAMEIRTMLDGVQGDLFNLARKWPKENMTWPTMAARLAKGGGGGLAHIKLEKQRYVRSRLISRLSGVGKDRLGGSATDLDSIWTQILEHLYTVFGLIEI